MAEKSGPGAKPRPPPFVEDYLAYLLARASHLVSSEFHARLAAAGIAVPVWRVLAVLHGRDDLVIGTLARMVLLKQPTLSKVLDRMIADGLVIRSPASDDRRRVPVAIPARGRRSCSSPPTRCSADSGSWSSTRCGTAARPSMP